LLFLTGQEVSDSDALPLIIYVRPPRWSVSTMVRWRRNMQCHQQRWSSGSLFMTHMAYFSVTCTWHGATHACCALVEPVATTYVQNYVGCKKVANAESAPLADTPCVCIIRTTVSSFQLTCRSLGDSGACCL